MEYATLLNMDRQGRIVIPIQVRKALKLEEGDLLALEANEKNILLRKQTAYIPLDAGLKEFLDILHANVPSRILLCNETKVLAVKNYHAALNMPVTETIRQFVQKETMQLFSLQDGVYPIPSGRYPVSAFFPIPGETRYGSALGLLLCPIKDRNFSRNGTGVCKNDSSRHHTLYQSVKGV